MIHLVQLLVLWVLAATFGIKPTRALSWGGGKQHTRRQSLPESSYLELRQESRLPNIYAVAMSELQELESEPLCHRIAARLLVNNCQLLDGKDDATVLTDSGRQVRDFVDSYAASLAICDLERGSFSIPSGCRKFREDVLAQVPASETPFIHVSTGEIDTCLSELASSDSAWNTWISYRHKSLRFCEAARVDNEKAQSVHLYQRLTEVLSKLTGGVELELEQYLQSLDVRTKEAMGHLDRLSPQISRLQEGLDVLEHSLSVDLLQKLRASTDVAQGGLDNARSLQETISILLQTVLENQAAVVTAHETALETANQRVNSELSAVMATLSAAAVTSVALHDQLETSRLRALDLEDRQTNLEQGLERLLENAEALSTNYNDHTKQLVHAHKNTDGILQMLQEMSTYTTAIQTSFSTSRWTAWWPYIVCPTISLVMGSYGLPPSIIRNIGLISLGEVAGVLVSSVDYIPLLQNILREKAHISPTYNQSLVFESTGDIFDTFSQKYLRH